VSDAAESLEPGHLEATFTRPEYVDEPLVAYEKQIPEPREVFRVLDFFAGCGGMSYGFASTRLSHHAFEVLGGVDIDGVALETYRANIKAPTLQADVRDLADAPEALSEFFPGLEVGSERNIFIGCAPCQGFSALRKGDDRDDARNDLLLAFARIVAHYRPVVVVMENVPELLSGRFSRYYRRSKELLAAEGYVFEEAILDLSLYGVPQRRRRAVVFASLRAKAPLPKAVFSTESALTVRDAISHLRPLGAGEVDPYDPIHRAPAHTARLLEMFALIPPDGGDRRDLPDEWRLDSHRRMDKSETPGFTDVYGRLRWDTPSVTITAKSRSPSSGRFLHPEQHRNISVREAALLQGFPPSYEFRGPQTRQYRQIGEAVPPTFSRHLAFSLLGFLSDTCRDIRPLGDLPPLGVSESPGLHVIDAFCGAGGLSLGLAHAGLNIAFAFDKDADAVATYRTNLGEHVSCGSIEDQEVRSRAVESIEEHPYLLVGGPPCQGFSHQRRGTPDDPRNHLVLRFAEFAGDLPHLPIGVILENVTDLELPRGRPILAAYRRKMEGLGYIEHRHVLNSADYGVPQLRRRIIIVFLLPEVAAHYGGPTALTPDRWPTVGEFLNDLDEPGRPTLLGKKPPNHVPSAESETNRRRIAHVSMGSGRLEIPDDLQLPCHAGDYRGHRDVYGRLDWFSQARTITGGFDSYTRGEFGHPYRHRSITHREGARLQGFPDSFEFVGNKSAVRRQIGNAVPPLLGRAIGQAVLDAWSASKKEATDG
jgi:DNA (cytosine-5)-methyltransferase 1